MKPSPESLHHRHHEEAREQIIDLLMRQAVERELVTRAEGDKGDKSDVVAQLVTRQQQAALRQKLGNLHPADIAFILESLPPDAREMAWGLVRPERRGAVLLETGEGVLRSLLSDMRPEEIAAVVRHLDPDDIAELVGSLPESVRSEVLTKLDRADQAEVRSVLSFPEDSVGAAMDLDFLTIREDAPLEAVLRLLRRQKSLPAEINQLIVVDRSQHLRGVLRLEQLLLSEPDSTVREVMIPSPAFFYTGDPVSEAVDAFEKYDLISAPVVNLHKQVVGRLTVDVVLDAMRERAESESLRQVGLPHAEDLYGPILQSSRNRWPWIGLNLVTAFASSRVIGIFDDVIVQIAAIATLIPIVASLGGNTGTQTMELVIRALALDQLGPAQLRRTFVKEVSVALLNGSIWGAALGAMTFLLYGKPALSLVIYGAMVIELVVAAFAGVAIPVALKRIGRDPVMGSSVLLTATTDTVGFFIFLGLATTFLL
jgi:magnesium transporter